ncbi:MAG: hypothetical protein ACKVJN_14670, partial [Woeseiales bacterium]|jgi:hypothetical protein
MIVGKAFMYKPILKFLCVIAIVSTPISAPPSMAQEDESDPGEGMRDCIRLRTVRRTEVLNDLNILFHMVGSTVYHNILPRRCSGLAREDRFSYKSSIGQLCRQDMIRVLYNDPFGLSEGNSCRLGAFHKITKEDALALKEGTHQRPRSNPLPMPTPEEVGADDDETSEESRR